MPETPPSSAAARLTALLDCRCAVPGLDTLTPYRINLLYLRLMQQGLDRYLFFGAGVSLPSFRDMLRSPQVWAYAGFGRNSGEPLALALLDSFEGRTARLHFTFFKGEGMARSPEIGRAFFDFLFAHSGLSCLLCLTPRRYRHSWRYGQALGCVLLGTIPGACALPDRRTGVTRYEDGMLLLYQPPTTEDHTMRGDQ